MGAVGIRLENLVQVFLLLCGEPPGLTAYFGCCSPRVHQLSNLYFRDNLEGVHQPAAMSFGSQRAGCEMSYRLADIAEIASGTDNFVNNPTSEFLRNRGLERWQGCLTFPCREDY